MNKMNIKRIVLVISALALSACSGNDKHDGLVVQDGNGKKYILKHNVVDTYFIHEVLPSSSKSEYVTSANNRILEVK